MCLLLYGCANPSTIRIPATDSTPPIPSLQATQQLIRSGDTLRIIRDAEIPRAEEMARFVVRNDGAISFPEAGTIQAEGMTAEALSEQISIKLEAIYRQPHVTVSIIESPGNRIFVGGEVRSPSAYPMKSQTSLEQALIGAGGILPTADARQVALLRQSSDGHYRTYFFDLSKMLSADGSTPAVALQSGDLVFVPKSGIGNAVEAMDLYFTRLLPINKGIGIGLNYDLNQEKVSNSGNTQNIYNLNGAANP